jgi:hypothetical protein
MLIRVFLLQGLKHKGSRLSIVKTTILGATITTASSENALAGGLWNDVLL